jgi:two-component system sensor histidine kinase DegS
VFRIIQEGFNNITKHSNCKAASLDIKISEKEVYIRIEDDGIGFDPSAVGASASVESGFGLYNIRERIDYLEGEFEVKSKRGKGTLLLAKIPLKEGEVREYGKND